MRRLPVCSGGSSLHPLPMERTPENKKRVDEIKKVGNRCLQSEKTVIRTIRAAGMVLGGNQLEKGGETILWVLWSVGINVGDLPA